MSLQNLNFRIVAQNELSNENPYLAILPYFQMESTETVLNLNELNAKSDNEPKTH
jgi:hypothetical protein